MKRRDAVSHKIESVIKRTGVVAPFNKERITNAIYRAAVAVQGRDRTIAEGLADQVVDILEQTMPPGTMPTVEDIQDIVEKVLIENGHARTAKAYILYREERSARRRHKTAHENRDSSNIPYRKLWETLSWAVDHDLYTVDRLNARIARGEFAQIVQESEQLYEQDIEAAVQMMQECCDELKIVIIAGPSSSGKTTTTIKIEHHLKQMGLNLVALNIDNYFHDLELHPKDEYGDYDFETPQALDLEMINDHLARLVAGQEVRIPFYDFKTGKRTNDVTPMRIGPNDIILIDSLHGMYADMTKSVSDDRKFKLYIETLLQIKCHDGRFIRWTDLRLMRRMVRDAQFRGYDPRKTLEHWHYVRSSELRHIIPHANSADYIVNSAMPYELAIMKPRLFKHFEQWIVDYRDRPHRQDAYRRARRVYELLNTVTEATNDAAIPSTSLMREFIGGSEYEY
ncbi:MAG: response regulator SirA [Anaerolineae bacterium]|nr:response regulator SirA [Anaerolineae bacterium]